MEYDVEVRTVHRAARTGSATVDSTFNEILSFFNVEELKKELPQNFAITSIKRLEIKIEIEDLEDEDDAFSLAEKLYGKAVDILNSADYSMIRKLLSKKFREYDITDVQFIENRVYNDEEFEGSDEPVNYTEYTFEENFGRILINQMFYPKFIYVVWNGLGYGLELSAFYTLEINRDDNTAYITAGISPRTYVYYGRTDELLHRAILDFEWIFPRQLGTTTVPENLRLENGVTYFFKFDGINENGHGIYMLVDEQERNF